MTTKQSLADAFEAWRGRTLTAETSAQTFDALVARVRALEDKCDYWQRVGGYALAREQAADADYTQIRLLQHKAVAVARREALEDAKEAAAVDDGLSYVAVCNLLDKEPKT